MLYYPRLHSHSSTRASTKKTTKLSDGRLASGAIFEGSLGEVNL